MLFTLHFPSRRPLRSSGLSLSADSHTHMLVKHRTVVMLMLLLLCSRVIAVTPVAVNSLTRLMVPRFRSQLFPDAPAGHQCLVGATWVRLSINFGVVVPREFRLLPGVDEVTWAGQIVLQSFGYDVRVTASCASFSTRLYVNSSTEVLSAVLPGPVPIVPAAAGVLGTVSLPSLPAGADNVTFMLQILSAANASTSPPLGSATVALNASWYARFAQRGMRFVISATADLAADLSVPVPVSVLVAGQYVVRLVTTAAFPPSVLTNYSFLNGTGLDAVITAAPFRVVDVGSIILSVRRRLLAGGSDASQCPQPPVLLVPGILGSTRKTSSFGVDTSSLGLPRLPSDPEPPAEQLALFQLPFILDWAALRSKLVATKQTVFDVPYDWSMHVPVIAAKYLVDAIRFAKQQTGCGRVVIVAHSMGGLVTRAYMQGPDYQGDVAKVVFIGTPQAGAAVTYLIGNGAATLADEVSAGLINPRLYTLASDYFLEDRLNIPGGYCNLTLFQGLVCDDMWLYERARNTFLSVFDLFGTFNMTTSGLVTQENQFLKALNGEPCANPNGCSFRNGSRYNFTSWSSVVRNGTWRQTASEPPASPVDVLLFVGNCSDTAVGFRSSNRLPNSTSALPFPDGTVTSKSETIWGMGDTTVPGFSASLDYVAKADGRATLIVRDASHTGLVYDTVDAVADFVLNSSTASSLTSASTSNGCAAGKGHRFRSLSTANATLSLAFALVNPSGDASVVVLSNESTVSCNTRANATAAPRPLAEFRTSVTSAGVYFTADAFDIDGSDMAFTDCTVAFNVTTATLLVDFQVPAYTRLDVSAILSNPLLTPAAMMTTPSWLLQIPSPPLSSTPPPHRQSFSTVVSVFMTNVSSPEGTSLAATVGPARFMYPPPPLITVTTAAYILDNVSQCIDVAIDVTPDLGPDVDSVTVFAANRTDDPNFYAVVVAANRTAVSDALQSGSPLVLSASLCAAPTWYAFPVHVKEPIDPLTEGIAVRTRVAFVPAAGLPSQDAAAAVPIPLSFMSAARVVLLNEVPFPSTSTNTSTNTSTSTPTTTMDPTNASTTTTTTMVEMSGTTAPTGTTTAAGPSILTAPADSSSSATSHTGTGPPTTNNGTNASAGTMAPSGAVGPSPTNAVTTTVASSSRTETINATVAPPAVASPEDPSFTQRYGTYILSAGGAVLVTVLTVVACMWLRSRRARYDDHVAERGGLHYEMSPVMTIPSRRNPLPRYPPYDDVSVYRRV